jgi:hypothetical protein
MTFGKYFDSDGFFKDRRKGGGEGLDSLAFRCWRDHILIWQKKEMNYDVELNPQGRRGKDMEN